MDKKIINYILIGSIILNIILSINILLPQFSDTGLERELNEHLKSNVDEIVITNIYILESRDNIHYLEVQGTNINWGEFTVYTRYNSDTKEVIDYEVLEYI